MHMYNKTLCLSLYTAYFNQATVLNTKNINKLHANIYLYWSSAIQLPDINKSTYLQEDTSNF